MSEPSAGPAFGAAAGPSGERAPRLLPYAFARRHGVLLAEGDRLLMRREAAPAAILEARRVAGRPLSPETIGDEAFDRLLSETYATDGLSGGSDTGEASQPDKTEEGTPNPPQNGEENT
ncbi:MAG: hypothetical protein ACK4Z0_06175, partial [Sphingomonadaceae bacterium]